MVDASDIKCIPCERGATQLLQEQIDKRLQLLSGWRQDGKKIRRVYRFRNFKNALTFVNQVGSIAEAEGHHPDIYLAYGRVEIVIWTHAINGLSENDFILAAKIDTIDNDDQSKVKN